MLWLNSRLRALSMLLVITLLGCTPSSDDDSSAADDDDSSGMDDDDASAPACSDDEFEENDDLLTSANLLPNGYGALVVCPEDVDWYNFEADAGDTIAVSIATEPGAPTLQFEVQDAYGTTLATAQTDEDPATLDGLETAAPDGDQYFLLIAHERPADSPTVYGLSLGVGAR